MNKARIYAVVGLFALLNLASAHALTVVSDIDDTLKISHVNDPVAAVLHLPQKTAFTGMSTAFQALAESSAAQTFYYLSASPAFLQDHLNEFVSENNFPNGTVHLRKLGEPLDVGAYKIEVLRQLLTTTIQDQVILLGDDTEKDPEAYAQVASEFPGRVQAIYIHQVTDRAFSQAAIDAGATRFLTSLDLAESFYSKGLITQAGLDETANSILAEKHTDRIVTNYQTCPSSISVTGVLNGSVDAILESAETRVQSICSTQAEE